MTDPIAPASAIVRLHEHVGVVDCREVACAKLRGDYAASKRFLGSQHLSGIVLEVIFRSGRTAEWRYPIGVEPGGLSAEEADRLATHDLDLITATMRQLEIDAAATVG